MFVFNSVIEHTELVNNESSPQGKHRAKCLGASDHIIFICFLCFSLRTYNPWDSHESVVWWPHWVISPELELSTWPRLRKPHTTFLIPVTLDKLRPLWAANLSHRKAQKHEKHLTKVPQENASLQSRLGRQSTISYVAGNMHIWCKFLQCCARSWAAVEMSWDDQFWWVGKSQARNCQIERMEQV